MKKEGSILIEVIASVCIITIVITVFVQAYISSINNLRTRMLEEELNMCIYSLSNEIKFNLSYDDIEKILGDKNEVGFKYDEDFLRRLTQYSIDDLERGYDIKILMQNCSSDKAEFQIEACISKNDNKIEKKYVFKKSWWMDEI